VLRSQRRDGESIKTVPASSTSSHRRYATYGKASTCLIESVPWKPYIARASLDPF